MGNIALLDELTINKIAAGEVIERPASVIKEMIENSIDANANNIIVEIKNGGISYIKITDNGKGIAQDDLEMAFERHATSKIRCAEDLNTVSSMGFRGEALASIAAIANVEMVSKTSEQEIGYKVVVEGGVIKEKEEIGCQTGTTITVRNLFFNTPVRYKFLKKDYTETGYIEDVVTRIALVNPNIAFKLINTGKTILQTSGNGDLKSVIYSIYGKDVADGIIEVNYDYEDMIVSGVIGKPEIARSNRSNQLFFVNKRYVKDKILTAATEQAYKGMIDAGKFGFVVLNLEMPQNKVDVNVHPAKLEVRFQEESKVFQAIFHTIKDCMAKEVAKNDTSIKVDNIIIQSSESLADEIHEESPKTQKPIQTPYEASNKNKTNGLFNWRKNKQDKYFGEGNNIVEALYNAKKENEISSKTDFGGFVPKAFGKTQEPKVIDSTDSEDDAVNTSDVLEELKHINENVKKEIAEEQAKKDLNEGQIKNEIKQEEVSKNENEENNNLPDGTTYTYVGENKEKIEELLRQLHPELEQATEKKPELEQVAEEKQEYKIENNNNNETVKDPNEVFELEKTQEIKVEEPIKDIENTQKIEVVKENKIDNESELLNNMPNDFGQMYEKLFGTPIIKETTEEEKEQAKNLNAVDIIKDNVSMFEGIEKYEKPTYKFIGVVFDYYIIIEIEKEMYIINQRTAKEKIMYENLKNNYYNQIKKDSQMLLLPDIIDLSQKQIEILKENYEILTKAGFSFEEFGENTIKLTGVPTVCLDLDTKDLFIEIIEEINTVARTSKQEKEEKIITTIASKIAEKGSLAVSIQEINKLIDELLRKPNPFEYGFDKQIALKMSKYDIERKFSRK